jgi:hypothetical protein
LALILLASPTNAYCFSLWPVKGPHRLFIGPEVYFTKRDKEGGSKQDGWMYGGEVRYERRPYGGFYWCLEGYLATGEINGKTASDRKLKSDLTDREIEGLLGYSFCLKSLKRLTIIPFGGYGYFDCKNDFKKPSPITCKYCDHFQYAVAGLEASFFPKTCLECGVKLKIEFMMEGKSEVRNDPEFDQVTLLIENENQWVIELPFRYYSCWKNKKIAAIFSPFYRCRHFGGRMNWPFDYIDTKFHNYGASFLLNIIF